MPPVVSLAFASGTLELRGWPAGVALPAECAWDERTRCHRAPGVAYAEVVRALVASRTPYEDGARAYSELACPARVHRAPRFYQTEALEAWTAHRGRGVVVLPTGSGKSHVALLAIDAKKRSTLVVAPTLDLVRQWFDLLDAQARATREWNRLFTRYDALIAPAFGITAFPHDDRPPAERTLEIDGETSRFGLQLAFPALAALPGLPATAVPVGKDPDGLPIGLQVISGQWHDHKAIAVARAAHDLLRG